MKPLGKSRIILQGAICIIFIKGTKHSLDLSLHRVRLIFMRVMHHSNFLLVFWIFDKISIIIHFSFENKSKLSLVQESFEILYVHIIHIIVVSHKIGRGKGTRIHSLEKKKNMSAPYFR